MNPAGGTRSNAESDLLQFIQGLMKKLPRNDKAMHFNQVEKNKATKLIQKVELHRRNNFRTKLKPREHNVFEYILALYSLHDNTQGQYDVTMDPFYLLDPDGRLWGN